MLGKKIKTHKHRAVLGLKHRGDDDARRYQNTAVSVSVRFTVTTLLKSLSRFTKLGIHYDGDSLLITLTASLQLIRLLRYAVRAAALVGGVFVCINCEMTPHTFPAFYTSKCPRIPHPAFYTWPMQYAMTEKSHRYSRLINRKLMLCTRLV